MRIVFPPTELITTIHEEQLQQHGGASGVRDEGLLLSALSRPLNKAGYEEPDLFEPAASYLFGIAKNHPFVDGNKRTAFSTADIFLALNGWNFDTEQAGVVAMVTAVAAGEISEPNLARWFRDHSKLMTD